MYREQFGRELQLCLYLTALKLVGADLGTAPDGAAVRVNLYQSCWLVKPKREDVGSKGTMRLGVILDL